MHIYACVISYNIGAYIREYVYTSGYQKVCVLCTRHVIRMTIEAAQEALLARDHTQNVAVRSAVRYTIRQYNTKCPTRSFAVPLPPSPPPPTPAPPRRAAVLGLVIYLSGRSLLTSVAIIHEKSYGIASLSRNHPSPETPLFLAALKQVLHPPPCPAPSPSLWTARSLHSGGPMALKGAMPQFAITTKQ